jgi:sporulation protein YlmC with PRC-barrel domain
MRAGELLGCAVVSSDGEKVGHVFELLADRSGPVVSELQGPALEICELFAGPRAGLLRLGYKSREMKGPHGLRFVQKRLRGYRIPWDAVEDIQPDRITLRCTRAELREL